MYDGWIYVAFAYGVNLLIFVIWFWMIIKKLRRYPDQNIRGTEKTDG